MKLDKVFWNQCLNEWGRGAGYKNRIAGHSQNWFKSDERQELEIELTAMLQREWDISLKRIEELL